MKFVTPAKLSGRGFSGAVSAEAGTRKHFQSTRYTQEGFSELLTGVRAPHVHVAVVVSIPHSVELGIAAGDRGQVHVVVAAACRQHDIHGTLENATQMPAISWRLTEVERRLEPNAVRSRGEVKAVRPVLGAVGPVSSVVDAAVLHRDM